MDWGAAVGAGVQGILSPINTYINNKMARENAKIDREENYKYNEMAADNADKRARAQYEDMYSPKAQLQQIKDAGLSPSLMYGGTGGAGGATAPQGAGAGGVRTETFPYSSPELGLMAAQIANIQADTKEKEATTENISEETIGQKVENYIKQTTLPQSIEQATQEVELLKSEIAKIKSETQGIDWKNAFNVITQDEQVKQLMNKNAELCARVLELEARANLHDKNATLTNTEREKIIAEINKMQKDVAQRYIELDIYNDSVHGQNRWFEEQAYQGIKNIELKTDMFNFEKGEKWEFEKYKVGKQIQLAGWKLGLDFGSSLLQSAVDFVGVKSTQGMKQLEIDTKKEISNKPKHERYYKIDKKGNIRITGEKYSF